MGPPAPAAAPAVPREPAADGGASLLLALAMFLAPAIGFPGEEMLQDTLKSMLVALAALLAALLFLLAQRRRQEPLRWHGCCGCRCCCAPTPWAAWPGRIATWRAWRRSAGSSSALIAWLGAEHADRASGCRGWPGACMAAPCWPPRWAALQFWTGLGLFPQGPQPGLDLRQPQLLRRVRGLHAALRRCCWRRARAQRQRAAAGRQHRLRA